MRKLLFILPTLATLFIANASVTPDKQVSPTDFAKVLNSNPHFKESMQQAYGAFWNAYHALPDEPELKEAFLRQNIRPQIQLLFHSNPLPEKYSDLNIEGSLTGVGNDILLEIVHEMDDPNDIQNLIGLNKITAELPSQQTYNWALEPMLKRQLFDATVDNRTFMARLATFIVKPTVINLKNDRGQTLLHIAVERGLENAVDLLLNSGANASEPDISGKTPVSIAFEKNQLRLIETFLRHDPAISELPAFRRITLCDAVEQNCKDVLRKRITQGTDLNERNWDDETPLAIACQKGYLDLIEILVGGGASPNFVVRDKSPLLIALENRHPECAEYLIRHGANSHMHDINQRTPLLIASGNGYLSVLQAIFDSGVLPPLMQDNRGMTPLYAASFQGHLPVVEFLLDHGWGDVNFYTAQQRRPLNIACEKKNLPLARLLLQRGADPNMGPDPVNKDDLLIDAVKEKDAELVRLIVDRGANVNANDPATGRTAFQIASENEDEASVAILREHGAH